MDWFDAYVSVVSDAFRAYLIEIPGTGFSFAAFVAAVILLGFVLRYFKNKIGGND